MAKSSLAMTDLPMGTQGIKPYGTVEQCYISCHSSHCQVIFVGEGAIDQGGPRREFFRLMAEEIGSRCMIGKDGYSLGVP